VKKVCVILVNYKTWQDTAECMESVLKASGAEFQIVVVENGSPDDSWEKLIAWADGQITLPVDSENPLYAYSHPPVTKPLNYAVADTASSDTADADVVFIRSMENLGFAGGNNIGLRYMLSHGFDYAWLLNNDTVIEQDAIQELVAFMEAPENSTVGIAGSKLRLYHRPDTLQGLGAIFNPYNGKSRIVGAQQVDHGQFDSQTEGITYAIGAAMFVGRNFLQEVGLMSEDYFLYNEENDWSARAHRAGWKVGIAVKSIVYHKQGASTGNSPKKSKLQIKALQYKYRGKILLYKKYYRKQLPYLYFHLFTRSMRYIAKGNFKEAQVIYAAIFNTNKEL
jgi:GT2 family glycosyltransferase